MLSMLALSMLIFTISITLMLINLMISKKMYNNREKATPYECGFDPLNATKESFSIQFFLISIMFLTFDIEIVILIPLVPATMMKSIYWLTSSTLIMTILIIGLYLEWTESSIKWET